MMGVADNFTPDKTYGTFTLDAKLYQGQNLVDESCVTYDCQALDPSLCVNERGRENAVSAGTYLLGGLLALAIFVGLVYIAQITKKWRA